MNVKIALDNGAIMPKKAHGSDAGFDLYCPQYTELRPNEVRKIKLGVHIGIPEGWYGQIEGRSGLASEGIFPIGGVIDSGYTGQIAVTLVNVSGSAFGFRVGERIAQLVLHPVPEIEWEEVDELEETERGSNGFGSTGR